MGQWKKTFANHTSDRRLISKMYRELIHFNSKKSNNTILKWANIQMVKSYMKRCLSPSSGKWKLKPLRYHLIHVRKAIIKKTINKRWWGCGEKGPLCSACGEGNGTPPQDSCLENPMDGGAWWAAVHGVTKSRTQLSDFPFTFPFHAWEKEMATHSSIPAWRIPWTEEPGGLQSMRSQSRTQPST